MQHPPANTTAAQNTTAARGSRQLIYRAALELLSNRKIPPKTLINIVQLHRFKRKTEGRPPGSVNQNHRYRKGIAGDWRNYFTAALIAEFKKRCNAGLLKLGYETDPDWT